MKIRSILLFVFLILIGIAIYIFWHFPIERKLQIKNCKVKYDYFRCGEGFGYKVFAIGPNAYYPNDFWFRRAKSEIMQCICEDYNRTKDNLLKNIIIDSLKIDNEYFERYLYLTSNVRTFYPFIDKFCKDKTYNLDKSIKDSIDYINQDFKGITDTVIKDKILQYLIRDNKFVVILPYIRMDERFIINLDTVFKYKEIIFEQPMI
jgi:hypothetical protein